MKTACVYHKIDLDGWMSGAVVELWWNTMPQMKSVDDSIEFIGFNYGSKVPDLSGYDQVILVDISFPKDEMFNLIDRLGNNFIWIDHHISAIKDMMGGVPVVGLQDTKFAACELAWQYFFPKQPMPEIVRLLGRYDCFGHKGTEEEQKVLEFQYGARAVIGNVQDAYDWLDLDYSVILQAGTAIYRFLCKDAEQSYKNGFAITLLEPVQEHDQVVDYPRRFICINKERFNPINFGIEYHKEGYDGAACFHRTSTGKWAFSFYNDNDQVDCSAIAKKLGGGGHRGAAGCMVDDINIVIK